MRAWSTWPPVDVLARGYPFRGDGLAARDGSDPGAAAARLEGVALTRVPVPLLIMAVGFTGMGVFAAASGDWGFAAVAIPSELGAIWFLLGGVRRRRAAARAMAAGAPYHQEGRHDLAAAWLLVLGGVFGGFTVGLELQHTVERALGVG